MIKNVETTNGFESICPTTLDWLGICVNSEFYLKDRKFCRA